jgi:HEAT repeat protein
MDTEKQNNRETAFRKLDELSSAEENASTELFLQCLAHPYQFIRLEAIRRVADYRIEKFTLFFALALNDEYNGVIEEAAYALSKLNSDESLKILSIVFFEDRIERPIYISNAISEFGERGFEVLSKGAESASPNIRYFSARGLGSTGLEPARPILEKLVKDEEKTTFGGLVSTAAKKGLKTLNKIQNAIEKSK